MRFKSIELQGFKSFVDKTELNFEGGISCIVGPNGSGKSNIMDAFRWVFGEQNPKELRGSGMDDIIFSGSESRKPSGYAEVALTITDVNEEITAKWGTLSEISIGRKYYRTGEREYLINNRKCKLKDIKEIFYDTGIGARSISIIEQGRVEKIIQATPEELRLFFEETAGVVKYREKKKESERRLNQTKENLFRVNDILSEINEKKETLVNQLEKLTRYKSLKEELDNLEKTLIINEYKKHFENTKEIQLKINEAKTSLTDKISSFEEERKQESALQKEAENIQKEIKELNELILSNVKNSHQTESEIKIIENNILNAEKSKISMSSEVEQLQIKLKNLTTGREDIYQQKNSIQKNLDEINEKIEEENQTLENLMIQKEDVDDELVLIENKFLKSTQTTTNLHNEIYRYETNIQRLEKEKERFSNEKNRLKEEIATLELNKQNLEKNVNENKELFEALKKQLNETNERETYYNSLKSKYENTLSQLKIDLSVCTENIKLNFEQLDILTFGDSKNSKILKELNAKLLMDYIPLEKNLLNETGDIIVFDSNEKEKVLSIINELEGSFRFLFKSDIENFEKELMSLKLEQISENIYMVNNLYKKAGLENKSIRIANLKNEIKNLKDKQDKIRNKIKEIQSNIVVASDKLKIYTEKKLSTRKQIQNTEIRLKTSENELIGFKENLDSLIRRQITIERELEVNTKETEASKIRLENIFNDLEKIKITHTKLEEEKEEFEEKRNFLILKIDDIKETISEFKINQRGYAEKSHSIQKEIHLTEQEITNTTNKIGQLKSRLEKMLNIDLTKWKTQLNEKKTQLEYLKKEEINLSDKKKYSESKLSEKFDKIKVSSEKIEKIQIEIKKIENKINAFLLKKTQSQSEVEHLQKNYHEKFKDDIANIAENFTADEDYQHKQTKVKINKTKQLIEGLGALNMAAEAEYEEVNERYDFLKKQKDDLEESIAKINELIMEINDNTASQFERTFNAVNDNFTDVFKILFGNSGKAELKLTHPEDLLTTGVDIFAQPPGKKLQNMNLLSGGEKAMTACTLLFAMFLYKPTPFCFLDEVDAPLDDANISRFINIVRKLSKNSQFVIITHNQKTMAEADSIYGVTMQEPGVSTILSVRLN